MKFDVILADPPWMYKVWDEETGSSRSALQHYPVMSLEQICDLSVRDLAAENCALFLWVPWAHLLHVPAVFEAWGFRYSSIGFLWVKSKPSGFGFYMGMGKTTRRNTEPCLLGIRGSMPPDDRGVSELIYSPVREHSRKPDEHYDKIERLYPGRRYLELFARRERANWARWGNEVANTVDLRSVAP